MKERIEVNPTIHFGKPCVAGTRIPVWNVLELLSVGTSFEQIIKEYYSDLTVDDIQACIRYAMDIVANEDIHIKVSA